MSTSSTTEDAETSVAAVALISVVLSITLAAVVHSILRFTRHRKFFLQPPSSLYQPLYDCIPVYALAVYRFFGLIWTWYVMAPTPVEQMRWFTLWSFCILTGYFSLTFFSSIRALYRSYRKIPQPLVLGNLDKLTLLVTENAAVTVVFVDIVVWTVLSPGAPPADFVDASVHYINWPILFLDLCLNRVYVDPQRLWCFLLYLLLYISCTWVFFFAADMEMPYFFLNLTNAYYFLWYVGILLLGIFFYLAVAKFTLCYKEKTLPDDFETGRWCCFCCVTEREEDLPIMDLLGSPITLAIECD